MKIGNRDEMKKSLEELRLIEETKNQEFHEAKEKQEPNVGDLVREVTLLKHKIMHSYLPLDLNLQTFDLSGNEEVLKEAYGLCDDYGARKQEEVKKYITRLSRIAETREMEEIKSRILGCYTGIGKICDDLDRKDYAKLKGRTITEYLKGLDDTIDELRCNVMESGE